MYTVLIFGGEILMTGSRVECLLVARITPRRSVCDSMPPLIHLAIGFIRLNICMLGICRNDVDFELFVGCVPLEGDRRHQ